MSSGRSPSGKLILDEETYIDHLDFIISRDFFPDLIRDKESSVKTDLSLSQFFARYVSEDNASFERTMEDIKKKHKEKYYWLDAVEVHKRLLLEYENADSGKSNHRDKSPSGYQEKDLSVCPVRNSLIQYSAKNTLMFPPKTRSSKPALSRKNSSQIRYENTRFQESTRSSFNFNFSSILSRNSSKKEMALLQTPTPQLSELGGAAFTTWGEVFASPMEIDEDGVNTLNSSSFRSPFYLPEAPIGEDIVRKLSEKSSRNSRDTPSSSFSEPRRPEGHRRQKLEDFSPAAQRLLQSSSKTIKSKHPLFSKLKTSESQKKRKKKMN